MNNDGGIDYSIKADRTNKNVIKVWLDFAGKYVSEYLVDYAIISTIARDYNLNVHTHGSFTDYIALDNNEMSENERTWTGLFDYIIFQLK